MKKNNSYLAIPQENVILCNNLCPVCTHIQVAIKKVINTFSHGLAVFNNKRFNTFEYNPVLVYCRELAPGTVSLTGDRAQGDYSKHDSHNSLLFIDWV